jgi:hypothetical protein
MGTGHAQYGNPVDDIYSQTEAIDLVSDGQIERRVDVALFLASAHMQVLMIGTAKGEAWINQG